MAYYPCNPTFRVGNRVKVVAQHKYPTENLIGLIGDVRSNYGSEIAVKFDNVTNERSARGYFYFKASELEKVDEYDNDIMEEKRMNNTKITGYRNIAKVKYINESRGSKDCTHQYANFDWELKAGDLCVVRTDFDQFIVARVFEIEDSTDLEMYREVVARVDTDAYDFRVESRVKAAELKAKMEARAKQLQDIALYQMLAKDDPDMAALLQEYQGLYKV